LLLAAVTPLVVVAGVIPVAYAASGLRAIPLLPGVEDEYEAGVDGEDVRV
jgi:hypothetical protein